MADMKIKPDEITSILKSRIEGLDEGGADLSEVGTVLSIADGIGKMIEGADEHFERFLELLAERHRMPAVFRIRRAFDELYAEERKLLPVTITSAVELDKDTLKEIGSKIEENTGRKVELTTKVDPYVLGGLVMRVGNMIMDGSIRARLERLRKQVAKAT